MNNSQVKDAPYLLDVEGVAGMCACSPDTVKRLSDRGEMPKPRRIGRLLRWVRQEIEAWIADGCPTTEGKS